MDDNNLLSGPDNWPVPVRIYDGDATLVRLTGLPVSMKKKAWGEIQSNSPALAELLREKALQDLVTFFDADIYIEAKHAPSLPPERLRGRNPD